MQVRELKEKSALHDFLIQDRVAAAYHLGDLDPNYFDFTRWWGAFDDTDQLQGLLLLYTGLRMPTVLALGPTEPIEALFLKAKSELPSRFYAHITADHVTGLRAQYRAYELQSMIRMGLTREQFTPADDDLSDIRTLTHSDTVNIIDLYQYYPDNFFEPYQLETGYYFGADENDRLVSIAGVHVFSQQYEIAAIGNIVTHPDFRSRGYSRRCTTHLLKQLFQHVPMAALNVQKDNEAAQSVYRRLGFSYHMDYLEGYVEQR